MDKELPDYKKNFLSQMEELRKEQMQAQNQLNQTGMQTAKRMENPNTSNNIINTAQYSSNQWRSKLNQTSFQNNYDDSHFKLNLAMNPQVGKKQNNIRSTQISEYSNARHNNTVFVNPKNTSC